MNTIKDACLVLAIVGGVVGGFLYAIDMQRSIKPTEVRCVQGVEYIVSAWDGYTLLVDELGKPRVCE